MSVRRQLPTYQGLVYPFMIMKEIYLNSYMTALVEDYTSTCVQLGDRYILIEKVYLTPELSPSV
jgi:hypothetical protein